MTISNNSKDLEKLNPLNIDGGNTKWYSHYGKQFVSLLKQTNKQTKHTATI